jgi:hypothetical protein
VLNKGELWFGVCNKYANIIVGLDIKEKLKPLEISKEDKVREQVHELKQYIERFELVMSFQHEFKYLLHQRSMTYMDPFNDCIVILSYN